MTLAPLDITRHQRFIGGQTASAALGGRGQDCIHSSTVSASQQTLYPRRPNRCRYTGHPIKQPFSSGNRLGLLTWLPQYSLAIFIAADLARRNLVRVVASSACSGRHHGLLIESRVNNGGNRGATQFVADAFDSTPPPTAPLASKNEGSTSDPLRADTT
jgi:hypothetical protein